MEAKVLPHYQKRVRFKPEAFHPELLGEGQNLRALLTAFLPGQFIPLHTPRVDLALVVLRGRGWLLLGEEEVELAPGSVAFVPAGVRRGIRAATKMVLFQAVAPPPSAEDHAEVRAGLGAAPPEAGRGSAGRG